MWTCSEVVHRPIHRFDTIFQSHELIFFRRFTKNLSPGKISLKFLKGEGELRNLELNEKYLTDLLELPPFIRLTRAVCNKISAKVGNLSEYCRKFQQMLYFSVIILDLTSTNGKAGFIKRRSHVSSGFVFWNLSTPMTANVKIYKRKLWKICTFVAKCRNNMGLSAVLYRNQPHIVPKIFA